MLQPRQVYHVSIDVILTKCFSVLKYYFLNQQNIAYLLFKLFQSMCTYESLKIDPALIYGLNLKECGIYLALFFATFEMMSFVSWRPILWNVNAYSLNI